MMLPARRCCYAADVVIFHTFAMSHAADSYATPFIIFYVATCLRHADTMLPLRR